MRMARLPIVGMALLMLLGGGLPVLGDDDAVTEDVLFEVSVPASAVPDPFLNLYFEGHTIAPGADGFIRLGVEYMRGRALYVDAGELVIAPGADALLWRQEATVDGEPEDVPAGESVSLMAGDLILLPAIPRDEVDTQASIHIANPGTETSVTYGFHMCTGGGGPAWPEGVATIPPYYGVAMAATELAPLSSEDAVVRLTRRTLEPSAATGLDEEALFGLHRLESGAVDASFTSTFDDKVHTLRWEPGQGLPTHATKTDWELRAMTETPASMLSLEGIELGALPE
jgi:hypothetical protein